MRKIVFHGFVSVLIFFGTLFFLTQFDWLTVFKIRKVTYKTENKLGEIFWDIFKKSEEENKNIYLLNPIDSIVTHICESNDILRKKIKIHVLNNDEINAFALPNGHLIINRGLIISCENQEELTGVICHEIAHIELNHVMTKLVKELGISVLISMTTNNTGTEIVKETAKQLSSSAFDRKLEKEADIVAVEYLLKANINVEPLANFLNRLSEKEKESPKFLTWISSHPDSKERAKYIMDYRKKNVSKYKKILTLETWKKMKEESEN